MQKPINDADEYCPSWHKHVKNVCHKCPLWIQVRGTDKNNGKEVDYWSCTWPMLAILQIENSSLQRETGAAVESLRNEVVKDNIEKRQSFEQLFLPFNQPPTQKLIG